MEPSSLATIVFTSGTTGQPKGAMFSHDNILQNAAAGLERVSLTRDDQPASVGRPLPDVEIKIGVNRELLTEGRT